MECKKRPVRPYAGNEGSDQLVRPLFAYDIKAVYRDGYACLISGTEYTCEFSPCTLKGTRQNF